MNKLFKKIRLFKVRVNAMFAEEILFIIVDQELLLLQSKVKS